MHPYLTQSAKAKTRQPNMKAKVDAGRIGNSSRRRNRQARQQQTKKYSRERKKPTLNNIFRQAHQNQHQHQHQHQHQRKHSTGHLANFTALTRTLCSSRCFSAPATSASTAVSASRRDKSARLRTASDTRASTALSLCSRCSRSAYSNRYKASKVQVSTSAVVSGVQAWLSRPPSEVSATPLATRGNHGHRFGRVTRRQQTQHRTAPVEITPRKLEPADGAWGRGRSDLCSLHRRSLCRTKRATSRDKYPSFTSTLRSRSCVSRSSSAVSALALMARSSAARAKASAADTSR